MTKLADSHWELFLKPGCSWSIRMANLLTERFIPFYVYFDIDVPFVEEKQNRKLDIEIFPSAFRDGVKIGGYTALLIHLGMTENDL